MAPNAKGALAEPPDCPKARLFLKALSAGASVRGAAWAAGHARSTFYRWRTKYPAFQEAWEMAVEDGTDRLEDEAYLRATEGRSKPIFYGGRLIGHEKRHSDQLLMFLLKARRPQKYDPGNTISRPSGQGAAVTSQFLERIAKLLAPADQAQMQPITPSTDQGDKTP